MMLLKNIPAIQRVTRTTNPPLVPPDDTPVVPTIASDFRVNLSLDPAVAVSRSTNQRWALSTDTGAANGFLSSAAQTGHTHYYFTMGGGANLWSQIAELPLVIVKEGYQGLTIADIANATLASESEGRISALGLVVPSGVTGGTWKLTIAVHGPNDTVDPEYAHCFDFEIDVPTDTQRDRTVVLITHTKSSYAGVRRRDNQAGNPFWAILSIPGRTPPWTGTFACSFDYWEGSLSDDC